MKGQGTRMKFTDSDDIKLIQIVREMDKIDWKEVAKLMRKWSPRQCRDRYNNYLSPNVQNKKWTIEEDKLLLEKYRQFGPKWSFLTRFFPNRAAVNIKNHYTNLQMKSIIVKDHAISANIFDGNNTNKNEQSAIEKLNTNIDSATMYDQLFDDNDDFSYSFDLSCDEIFLI